MPPLPPLTPEERLRFERQIRLSAIGEQGQRRIKASAVLIVGVGGLGCPAAQYLAAAGVGRLGLVDHDRVESSNLHRQILFGEADIGRHKVDVAAGRLAALDSALTIETHASRFTVENALDLASRYDLVLDGTDNFSSRYLLGDACSLTKRPLIQGSVERFSGRVARFMPQRGCHRCLFPDPPAAEDAPSCAEAGVLGVVPGAIGTLMASEAIALAAKLEPEPESIWYRWEFLTQRSHRVRITRDPECRLCSDQATIKQLSRSMYDPFEECAMNHSPHDIEPKELRHRLKQPAPPLLLDVREDWEWNAGHLAGAIHLPMHALPLQCGELPADREIVVYCAVGVRSAHAAALLRRSGFLAVLNLEGGIERWAEEIGEGIVQ